MRHEGLLHALTHQLQRAAQTWFEDTYAGTMEQAKQAVCSLIHPILILSMNKANLSAKMERWDFVRGEEGNVLDVLEMYTELDNFATTNHWSAWMMCRQLWSGAAYEGQLARALTGDLKGKTKYLSLTDDKQRILENQVVEMSLAYYQWKVALLQKIPRVENDGLILERIQNMVFPTPLSGSRAAWKMAYQEMRNEYAKIRNSRSAEHFYLTLKTKCRPHPATQAWMRAIHQWKELHSPYGDWTMEKLDQAVDSVYTAAESGLSALADVWPNEGAVASTARRAPQRNIAVAVREGSREPTKCYCNLQ